MTYRYKIFETQDSRHNSSCPLRVDVLFGANERKVFFDFAEAVEFCKFDRQEKLNRGMDVHDFADLATRVLMPKKEFLYMGEVAI